MSSIFIQIPSYHDYEIGRTIRDAIKKSSGNNTINFGLHVSYYKTNDLDIPVLDNVKIKIRKQNGRGPVGDLQKVVVGSIDPDGSR